MSADEPDDRGFDWDRMRSRIIAGVAISSVIGAVAWTIDRQLGGPSGTVVATSTTSSAAPSPSTPTTPTTAIRSAVSFDDVSTRRACALLTTDAIASALGAAVVGAPVPLDPACQWPIDADGFLALSFEAQRPWSELEPIVGPLEEEGADGVGTDAIWAATKALYFGTDTASGSIAYQRAGEWSDEHRDALVALANQALAAADAEPEASTRAIRCAPGCERTALSPIRIWVGGDSMIGATAWILRGNVADASREVIVEQQVATGIVRSDIFDWPRHLEAVAGYLDPDVAVFFAGANDNQSIALEDSVVAFATDEWDAAYTQRIERIMDTVAADGRTLIWVGTPTARDPEMHGVLAHIDDLASAAAATRPGVVYMDLRTLLAPEAAPGVYSDRLVLPAGTTRIRNPDGLHLSVEGSQYLALLIAERIAAAGYTLD